MSSFPFLAPTWSGIASISGRTITRISGDTFADGYPSVGVFFLFDPAVLDGITNIPPYFIDDGGSVFYRFATWFVDADHLALNIDATYDLLIPAGTVGTYAPSVTIGGHVLPAYKWPAYSRAVCWADGSHITSNPQGTLSPDEWDAIHTAYPFVAFGGDAFDSPTSDLVGHPQVYIHGTVFTVGAVDSSTDIDITGSTGGVVVVLWLEWNVPPPPTGSPTVLGIAAWAYPAGSAAASLGYLAAVQCGFIA